MGPNRKDVEQEITKELGNVGIDRKADMLFSHPALDEKVYGWIGLNTAVFPIERTISVNPVVGFIHKDIQKIAMNLTDKAYKKNHPPLLGENVGYLMPQHTYTTWDFKGNKKDINEAQEISKALIEYGIPWIVRVSDLGECLVEMVEKKKGMPGQREYKIPIVLHYLGRTEEGRKFIEDFKLEMIEKNTHQDILDRYTRFAEKYNTLLERS